MLSESEGYDLRGDAGDQRFWKAFELLARHDDLWDIAFVVSFPNLVPGSEQIANEIIRFSDRPAR